VSQPATLDGKAPQASPAEPPCSRSTTSRSSTTTSSSCCAASRSPCRRADRRPARRQRRGKSTTLKAISGLLKTEEGEVTRGDIRFAGERPERIEAHQIVRKGIFQVMEGRRIVADMTCLENLRLGAFTRSTRR
jgi:hypothetical protein